MLFPLSSLLRQRTHTALSSRFTTRILSTPSRFASSMSNPIEEKLAALGITVPAVSAPVANYVPYTFHNGTLYISGQIGKDAATQQIVVGQLGDLTVEEGQAAARQGAVSLIAVMKAALGGDLTRVKKVVKLTCFVNSKPDFTQQPAVANGCSDLMVEVFGPEIGRHARCAVGNSQLPLGAAVEVEAIVAVEGNVE